jgi:uncharacterized tellurite resistance protein B-like protein
VSFLRLLGIGGPREPDEPEALRQIADRLEALPRDEAVRLAAFACVLVRVAHADLRIDEAESAAMQRIVAEEGGLDPAAAGLVVEIAKSRARRSGGTDDYLVTREYRRLSSREERAALLGCLFAVAAADDTISDAESQQILAIGEELGFTRAEVLSLRAAWREKISVLRGR